MARTPADKKRNLRQLMDELGKIDLNEIDFKNAGSWPRGGKMTAWGLILIISLIVGYFVYISPKFQELDAATAEEKRLLQEYEIKAFQGANLNAYKQQMQDIQQQITTLSAQLPTQRAIPELIEQIGEQAQRHRVDIRGLKLRPEETLHAYNGQPMTLTVSGHYHNIAAFLAGMTQLQRIVTLHDFTLEPDNRQLRLTIEAMAYHNTPETGDETGGVKND